MFGKPSVCLFLLVMATISATSHAQTIYNDGGTHTVSGSSGPVAVLDGTTLNVAPVASITGGAPAEGGFIAAAYGDTTSTLNFSGGSVVGSSQMSASSGSFLGVGFEAVGSFTATGGSVQGGSQVQPGFADGGSALLLSNTSTISGGTFIGGSATGGGDALEGYNSSLTISGGIFTGGASNASVGRGGIAVYLSPAQANSVITISGGTFTGGSDAGGGPQGYSLYVDGGAASSQVNVSGGTFNGDMSAGLNAGVSLNFFGTGFSWTENTAANTLSLSGTLSDGTSLDTTISLSFSFVNVSLEQTPGGGEEFSIIGFVPASVPEPRSIVTLSIGLLATLAGRVVMRKRSE